MISVSLFLSTRNGGESEQNEDDAGAQVDSGNDSIVELALDDRVNTVLIRNALLNALGGVEEWEVANAAALKLLLVVPDFFELFLIVGNCCVIHLVTCTLGSELFVKTVLHRKVFLLDFIIVVGAEFHWNEAGLRCVISAISFEIPLVPLLQIILAPLRSNLLLNYLLPVVSARTILRAHQLVNEFVVHLFADLGARLEVEPRHLGVADGVLVGAGVLRLDREGEAGD